MPQFVPAVTQFVTTDVQNTATNTVGASTVNLRGLGANRTLVLLDGRRAMPVNASLVVDINTIPAAAIKRVEVITGGASSAYGADAVGGVVNFILKNDFEGMEFDTQYGITEFGDDQELRVSALMGGNFSDNRGNAMFGVEYFKRGDARQDERDFFTKGWADPSVNGTEFFMSDTYWTPTPCQPAVAGGDQPDLLGCWRRRCRAQLVVLLQQGRHGLHRRPDPGWYRDWTARTATTACSTVASVASARTARSRRTSRTASCRSRPSATRLFGRADYDVADNLAFFIQGNFSKTSTQSVLQLSPATGGWGVNDSRSMPLIRCRMNSAHCWQPSGRAGRRSDWRAPWTLNRALDFVGPRGSSNDNTTYQVLAGFNGNLPFGDWTWEAYVSHGNTEVTNTLSGFASRERVRALLQMPNYGAGAVIVGNQTPPGNGFAVRDGHLHERPADLRRLPGLAGLYRRHLGEHAERDEHGPEHRGSELPGCSVQPSGR